MGEKDQIQDTEEINLVQRKQTKIYVTFDQMSKYRIQTISKGTHKQLKYFSLFPADIPNDIFSLIGINSLYITTFVQVPLNSNFSSSSSRKEKWPGNIRSPKWAPTKKKLDLHNSFDQRNRRTRQGESGQRHIATVATNSALGKMQCNYNC